MPENIVERAVVPQNPSPTTALNRDHYSLFAPIGGINKVGLVGYSTDFKIDANHFVSIRENAITTEKIADEAITTEKIAPDAIVTTSIEDGAVDMEKLSNFVIERFSRIERNVNQIQSERRITGVEYDNEDEVITFIFADGTSTDVDLPVESLVKDLTMDEDGNIVLTLEGDQTVTVSTQVIADAIAKNEKSIIPADSVHCRREADGIHLTDNSGKTVVIPLLELHSTKYDSDIYGLVKIMGAGGRGLALNGGYLTTNPANAAELNGKTNHWKVVVPENFAAGLNANLKAGEGIALSYDETAKEVTVSATGSGGGTIVKVNGEAVLEFDADTKVEKLKSGYNVNSVYTSKPDGSTGLLQTGRVYNQIPVRETGGNIPLPLDVFYQPQYAVPKKYVDSLGIPSFSSVFWEGSLSKGQVGIENTYINIPLRITYDFPNSGLYSWRGTVTTNALTMGSDTSSELSTPLFTVGSEVYRIVCSFWFTANYDGNYETSYSEVYFNCQKLNGSTWEDTTDIAVTKIEY